MEESLLSDMEDLTDSIVSYFACDNYISTVII